MRRVILFLSLILCFGSVLFAQSSRVKQANDLYSKGNYSDAAKLYEKVLATEGVAPELYYNLGNAYYKLSETGKSILNYERAIRLAPTFEDAHVNLELAQLKVVDNIVQTPTFFLGRWIENLIKLLTSNQWIAVSFSVFIIFSDVRKDQMVNHREAIVMTGVVTVKSSPDKSGTDLFQLHEGTKVVVKSTLGKWTEIILGNGNIGWVEQDNIENI